MAKEFIPIFLDFNEKTQELEDAECGRLIRALVAYANGEEDYQLTGAERLVFRFLKDSVDRSLSISEARAKAGASKKNNSESKQNKEEQNETKPNKNYQNETNRNDKDKDKDKDKEIKKDDDNTRARDAFMTDGEALAVLEEQDKVLTAAENAGFAKSESVRARLISLYATNGLKKMLDGIDACVKYGVSNLAYLEAAMKGDKKKPTTRAVLPAQDYAQRDYSTAQDEAFERMLALAGEGGS